MYVCVCVCYNVYIHIFTIDDKTTKITVKIRKLLQETSRLVRLQLFHVQWVDKNETSYTHVHKHVHGILL